MPTTPIYGLRYPAAADPADVPTDIGELATDVETLLNTKAVVSNDTRGTNKVPVWNGSAWVYSLVTNAMVDPAAAIAQSKLAFDAPATFVPTWTSTGTAPAIGNSAVVAQYVQVGKLVTFWIEIIFGSTATYGTGAYRFALPVTSAVAARNLGTAQIYDTSTNTLVVPVVVQATATTLSIEYPATTHIGADTSIGPTAPWTWANTDVIRVHGSYLAA